MSDREQNGGDQPEAASAPGVWPEVERAEILARGAALKWASGVFCRPEHLERLGQYRKRESQRTTSIHSRLKSVVQSYLEGVGWGLQQLHEARVDLEDVSHTLRKAGLESGQNSEGTKALDTLRELSINHCQLLAAVSNLPRLYSVRSVVQEAERLVESRRLLEAHARLMELERWQDDVLWQLHAGPGASGTGARAAGSAGSPLSAEDQELVTNYFSGVGRMVEALGKELWAVVSSGLALARQNPTPFVSAVRIIEREEALDQSLLEERGASGVDVRPLPPGRPRCWRERFFQVLEEAVATRFRSMSYLHTRGPGLAAHLSALQHGIMADLTTVRNLLEHCVPPCYRLTGAYLCASHRCLQSHLAQVSGWELESGEIFAVLNWVLHIYTSPDMMGHPDLSAELERVELGPLIALEGLEQLHNKYVHSVRKSVSEWMHKALEVELTDWQRDQEPDTDHEGFYQTSLPTIITQMLEENARVALMISVSLRDQTIQMGLYEMENLLNRFRDALVEIGKEHRRDHSNKNQFYLHYLLASISNCIILKASTESLQNQQSSRSPGRFSRTPPGPLAALDRAVRRACRLVMDQLLLELQPFLQGVLSRSWLAQGEPTPKACRVLEKHLELYARVRPPCRQRLQEESQWLTVVEYVRAVMQKRLVCRGPEDRRQLAQRIVQDEQQLRDLYQGLECEGSVSEVNPMALLPVLADFLRLKDPGMLTLEVSGMVNKYPDISEEHVLVLLDIRGDVPRHVRGAVLDLLEQSAPPLPAGYRPIFTDILVPPSSMPFCLPTAKCA
ncbi:exocyst complex component 3-like protein [Aplochiton taeniatus]